MLNFLENFLFICVFNDYFCVVILFESIFFKMKKQCLIIIALSLVTGFQAISSPVHKIKPAAASSSNAVISESAYYYTPMGVTFMGAEKDERFSGNYAFASVDRWFETVAEIKSGTLQWSYSDGLNSQGGEDMLSSTSPELRWRVRNPCVISAPMLSVKSGRTTYTYTMASEGVRYGEIGTATNYAVNYQPDYTTGFDTAPDVLSVNDADATANLNFLMAMGGSIFSDIEVLGFSESFYECGDFYLESISAEIYCTSEPTTDDLAVKVFRREKTSVSTEEIAQLTCTDIYSVGSNRYYVTFTCDEPTFVTTAMQVVVLPAHKEFVFSPVVPLQSYYRSSNAGTAAFYANFSLVGKPCEKQYLDFFGTETSDDNGKVLGYINNWAIGIKGSYDKPSSGIDDITVDRISSDDDRVYNIMGAEVGRASDAASLPAGIYISGGKKFIVR